MRSWMNMYIQLYIQCDKNRHALFRQSSPTKPFLRSLNRYTLVLQLFLSRMKLQLAPSSRDQCRTLKGKSISRHAAFERGKNLDYVSVKMKAPRCPLRSRTMEDVDTFTRDVSWHYVAVAKLKSDSHLVSSFIPYTGGSRWFYDEITHDRLLHWNLG